MTTPATAAPITRTCADCLHRRGGRCRHPLDRNHGGRFAGLASLIANPPPEWRAVTADHGCGWYWPQRHRRRVQPPLTSAHYIAP